MINEIKKGKTKKETENLNESNSLIKSKEGKSKKKSKLLITGEEEDSKEDSKDEERNYRYKTDERRNRYRGNIRRVDRVKKMFRKEIGKEPKQKTDEDKSKKKEIKKEESISSWSVESVEVIKENGVYKKDKKEKKWRR